MESRGISYELLRCVAARAWDEGDKVTLEAASSVVDAAMLELLADEAEEA